MEIKPLLPPVVVNGVTIPAGLIAAEAQNHPAPTGKPGHAWKAAARALALRELMLQAARAEGLVPQPAEIAPGQWETDDEALVRQLLELRLRPAPPAEAELRALYDGEPERFRAPSVFEAAHILFPAAPGDAAARARALAEATRVLAELRADPRRFADLARAHSACSSRAQGGLLGQLASGDTVPEFEAAMAALSEGEIAPAPVATRYGFHLLRLDAHGRGAVLPFAAVLPRLRAAAEKAAWVRASRALAEDLARRADIRGVTLGAVPEPATAG